MDLSKYNLKRNFNSTKEPEGVIKKSKNELIFVVQKHAASHLHYDFRIEMDGVLKSWAIPKGPSMHSEEKRLAIMVEDHPYAYKDFEGTIPEGNYGAGNVIVWDKGTYALSNQRNGTTVENQYKEDIRNGKLDFILDGKKLKGEFALVRLHVNQKNAWLLIKKDDEYATDSDVLLKDKSVLSDMTLDELE
ncbi:bifunctional non-homologous end joining protein LigD [Flavobacterium fluvii]|uniref:Bifunctional non-homologous end joining protein LigD n=1 Tax=Flavobacterium fluvii TaxID=468056 RepID=A0A1M5MBX1_9FLAO|nr:DNA polymerase ligase N-terminal domain-containing protein [Flavobacterium fluvii]SHG74711.1 bifunctional non-homologous end joining protein LigD [Flavobacterium fluvii]